MSQRPVCEVGGRKCNVTDQWREQAAGMGIYQKSDWRVECAKLALGIIPVREFIWYNCSAVVGCLFGGSMVGLMVTSSKRAYAIHYVTQVCWNQDCWEKYQ